MQVPILKGISPIPQGSQSGSYELTIPPMAL
jgi:hypothetical protein